MWTGQGHLDLDLDAGHWDQSIAELAQMFLYRWCMFKALEKGGVNEDSQTYQVQLLPRPLSVMDYTPGTRTPSADLSTVVGPIPAKVRSVPLCYCLSKAVSLASPWTVVACDVGLLPSVIDGRMSNVA